MKNKQTKIDFSVIQVNGNVTSASYNCTGKVIDFASYVENKVVEIEKKAIRNSLLHLATKFPQK